MPTAELHAETIPVSQRRYLNIPTAATYVGLSVKSVRRLIDAGKLGGHRPVRGRILIDRIELEQLVATATQVPSVGRGLHNDLRAEGAAK
ncbi:MAG: helix-turn-helix domain-containing protein [Pirellulaceae bacterium]|nr:helix-turn-helix domain-containing protein [Pirellulaceae bacterium]